MKYKIYKLSFKAPVHFGNGRLSMSGNSFYADTFFSALYKEAITMYGENEAKRLYEFVIQGKLILSDAMPYKDNTLYIPKPTVTVIGDAKNSGDSSLKKRFKKLKFIPVNELESFVDGNYIPPEQDISFGESDIRTNVAVIEDDDNKPYNVGIFSFYPDSGLYVIVGTSDDAVEDMFDSIMDSLSYAGIGGKVSAGFGRFDYQYQNADSDLTNHLTGEYSRYISLSISLAKDNELEQAVNGAYYEIIKRSGFIASHTYSEAPEKKRDMFCFKGGACFQNRFAGDVFDVSNGGSHPVYRYLKPMFYGI